MADSDAETILLSYAAIADGQAIINKLSGLFSLHSEARLKLDGESHSLVSHPPPPLKPGVCVLTC